MPPPEKYKKLTKRQEKCLYKLAQYVKTFGNPPTRQELVKLFDQKSVNGVNQILSLIEKKGYIKIYPKNKTRNIIVVHAPDIQLDLFRKFFL